MIASAGFIDIRATGYVWVQSGPELVGPWVDSTSAIVERPDFLQKVIENGWSDQKEIRRLVDEMNEFAKLEDSYIATIHPEIVGWKP